MSVGLIRRVLELDGILYKLSLILERYVLKIHRQAVFMRIFLDPLPSSCCFHMEIRSTKRALVVFLARLTSMNMYKDCLGDALYTKAIHVHALLCRPIV